MFAAGSGARTAAEWCRTSPLRPGGWAIAAAVGPIRARGVGQEIDDLAEGAEGAEVLGLDRRSVGEPVLQCREDLHPLDRVDPQVGVELHLQLEHLHRIPGLLRHHLQEHRRDEVAVARGDGLRGHGHHGVRLSSRTGNRGCGRGRNGRSGGQGFKLRPCAVPQGGQAETLLLLQELLERPLGRRLALEELTVQLRCLLRQPLERDQVLLGLLQSPGQASRGRRRRFGGPGAGGGIRLGEPDGMRSGRQRRSRMPVGSRVMVQLGRVHGPLGEDAVAGVHGRGGARILNRRRPDRRSPACRRDGRGPRRIEVLRQSRGGIRHASSAGGRIGSANLHRQALATGARRRCLVSFIPPLELHRITKSREVREDLGQAGQVAFPVGAGRRIDGQRPVFSPLEDRADQAR